MLIKQSEAILIVTAEISPNQTFYFIITFEKIRVLGRPLADDFAPFGYINLDHFLNPAQSSY